MIEKSEKELSDYAKEHLYYEIMMVIKARNAIKQNYIIRAKNVIDLGLTIRNALLESYLLHIRILIDFLINTERLKDDDVLAIDFFEDIDGWKAIIAPKKERLETLKKRLNKELAHLTYTRANKKPEERGWTLNEHKEILDLLKIFIKKVPERRIPEDLRNFVIRNS